MSDRTQLLIAKAIVILIVMGIIAAAIALCISDPAWLFVYGVCLLSLGFFWLLIWIFDVFSKNGGW